MNGQLTSLTVEEMESIAGGVPCEGSGHPYGIHGHDPEADAAFLLVCPLCGPDIAQCAPRVAEMKTHDLIQCDNCKMWYPTIKWGFVPL